MSLIESVRRSVGEPLVGAARFRPRPGSTGPAVGSVVIVAASGDRVFVLDGRWSIRGRTAGAVLAAYDRSEVAVAAEVSSESTRVTLKVPPNGVWLDLDSTLGDRRDATELASLLVGGTSVRIHPGVVHPAGPGGSGARVETEESLRLHRRTGWLAIIGALVRFVAYLMPWVAVSQHDPRMAGNPVVGVGSVSGAETFGRAPLSLLPVLAVVVLGTGYLHRRRRHPPIAIGISALLTLVVLLVQVATLGHSMAGALAQPDGTVISTSYDIGVWVELLGVLLVLASARTALRAYAEMGVVAEPVRPDLARA